MSLEILVQREHLRHSGGTKEYFLDHIKIFDSEAGGNGLHCNHIVTRWGGIGKRRSNKVEHDPALQRFTAIKAQKVKRGYEPGGVEKLVYRTMRAFAAKHGGVLQVLIEHTILPAEITDQIDDVDPAARVPDAFALPEQPDGATALNPNLGIF